MDRLTRIELENIKGHERLVIEPGEVTFIMGGNGTGKSSLIDAVIGAIKKGASTEDLLMAGADAGRVRITTETGVEIGLSLRRDGSPLRTVRDPNAGNVGAPAAYLEHLFGSAAIDPFEVLRMPGPALAKYVLETVPVQVDDADVVAVATQAGYPMTVADVASAAGKAAGFDRLAAVRKALYERRTAANAIAARAGASVADLTGSLVPESEAEDVRDLRGQRDQVVREIATMEAAAKATLDAGKAALNQKFDLHRKGEQERFESESREAARKLEEQQRILREAADRDIAREKENLRLAIKLIEDECAARITAETKAATDDLRRREGLLKDAIEARRKEVRAEYDGLVAAEAVTMREVGLKREFLATIEPRIALSEAAERVRESNRSTRERIARYAEEAAQSKRISEAMTSTMAGLDALRERIASTLPIPGLRVTDGEVYFRDEGGVELPFRSLNLAKRMLLGLTLAETRAQGKKAGLIVCDGLESIDDAALEAFVGHLRECGRRVQVIGAKHDNGPFRVVEP